MAIKQDTVFAMRCATVLFLLNLRFSDAAGLLELSGRPSWALVSALRKLDPHNTSVPPLLAALQALRLGSRTSTAKSTLRWNSRRTIASLWTSLPMRGATTSWQHTRAFLST